MLGSGSDQERYVGVDVPTAQATLYARKNRNGVQYFELFTRLSLSALKRQGLFKSEGTNPIFDRLWL